MLLRFRDRRDQKVGAERMAMAPNVRLPQNRSRKITEDGFARPFLSRNVIHLEVPPLRYSEDIQADLSS